MLTARSGWIMAKTLKALTKKEMDTFINSPSKKQGKMLEAYKVAADPTEWRSAVAADAEALAALHALGPADEDELMDEAEEANGAAKKRKRKSDAAESKPKSRENAEDARKRKKAKVEELASSKRVRLPPLVPARADPGPCLDCYLPRQEGRREL